ncbi:MAG: LURP-one-related family protein [Kurthia sp.]|nr:LURP-one-related family protein [Candidatus Kurthia equi]
MKQLYMRQKLLSLRDKFTIMDGQGNDVYAITGSFMKIPKSFSIMNQQQQETAIITKKVLSLLPTFFVELHGKEVVTIRKNISFFKARYSIEGEGIEVQGNWWDMNFRIFQHGEEIAAISKKWLSFGDSYEIQITKEASEELVIAIVVAIDCVKEDSESTSS